MNTDKIEINKISPKTIFKINIIGGVIGFTILTVIFGFLALFGAGTITLNETPHTGPFALLISPVLGAFIGLFFGAFISVFVVLGLKVWRSLNKTITIDVAPETPRNKTVDEI